MNGKPTPNVTWIKDGKIVGSGYMLTITAYKNQSGKYWCSAYNGLGERVNASANLNVQCEFVLFIASNRAVVHSAVTMSFVYAMYLC